jgi:1,2-phenylacetyl-CoA epoxidase catalytic subunit
MSETPPRELDEESRALLRRIVERQAYRQLMAANIRGHGLKYVPEIEEKAALARDLEASLAVLRDVVDLHARLGGVELEHAVRDQMERIPYPTTRLELAICLALCDRAERAVAEGYAGSRSPDLARIARALIDADRTATTRGEELFIRFCEEPGNRPAAQAMLARWLTIAVLALGRPGTPGDARAVALGLRTKRVADVVREFLGDVAPLVAACGLALPDLAAVGLELPAAAAAGRKA